MRDRGCGLNTGFGNGLGKCVKCV